MPGSPERPRRSVLRFGLFELDPATGELRRQGRLVRLQPQPAKVLALLASRAGELVTRDELQREIWGAETYVDFGQALNFSVRQMRAALGDSSGSPRYVETLPRRGYRFLAPVEWLDHPAPPAATSPPAFAASSREEAARQDAAPARRRRALVPLLAAVAVLAAAAAGLVAFALRGSPPFAGPRPDRALLAVLPFEDLSGRPWWTDGLTEELITQLGKADPERLGVIARTSAMRYKGSRAPVGRIARELGVDYLLAGSVRRSGQRLRITAQLITASDQTQLWAESYDRTAADVLAVQADVARRVTRALSLKLAGGVAPPAATPSGAAREAYLQGRYLLSKPTAAERTKSLAFFRRALAEDPDYAAAWTGVAGALMALPRPPRETVPRAREAARRALALEPDLAEAHYRLGEIHLNFDWDWPAAGWEYARAIELDPGFAAARHAYAAYFSLLGRHDEALAQMAKARELDPVSANVRGDVGWYRFFARRYGEAATACRQTLELEPRDVNAWKCLLSAQQLQGDAAAARSAARRILEIQGAPAPVLEELERQGLAAYWRWTLDQLTAAAVEQYLSPAHLALPHLALGDREAALQDLERAYRERSGWQLLFLAVEPRFDPLRTDPRFRDLLRRLRLAGSPAASPAAGLPEP